MARRELVNLHSWNDSLPLMKELGHLPDLEKPLKK